MPGGLPNDAAGDMCVVRWQDWTVSQARAATQFYASPFDITTTSTFVPGPDTPAQPFVVVAWQDWQAGQARVQTQFAREVSGDITVAPPGFSGPDYPFTIQPYFAGRVPLEAWQQGISNSAADATFVPPPDTYQSFISGGYRAERWNPTGRVQASIQSMGVHGSTGKAHKRKGRVTGLENEVYQMTVII